MNKKSITVCIPGSFDPPTIGHIRLIERSAALFDNVIVFISSNSAKKTLLSEQERKTLLSDALSCYNNIDIQILNGLLANAVIENGVSAIVKGLRNAVDFSYEYDLFDINNSIGKSIYSSNIESIFLPSEKEYISVSSTMVRELIKYNADFTSFVPNAQLLSSILKNKKGF